MGISFDFEVKSMESETKPTCNKEIVKINAHNGSDKIDVKIASTIANDVILIDDIESTTVNSSSSLSREVCLNTFYCHLYCHFKFHEYIVL